MQVQLPTREIVDSGVFTTATFKIPEHAMAKASAAFISDIYSNETRFVAELVANGVDASPGRVKVTLPTRLEPQFVVEDEGPGMSPEFMMGGPYTQILVSTKDHSDQAIGGWGVGRLSALAITDSYFVVTRGHQYLVRKNQLGIPEIMHAGAAGYETVGTKVTVPVPTAKVQDVQEAARKYLCWHDGLTSNLPIPPVVLTLGSRDLGWAFVKGQEKPLLVMGGYPYELDLEHAGVPCYATYPWRGLAIFADPGFAAVTLNRESLNYCDKTKANLKERLEKVKTDLVAVFEAELSQVATIFEAKRKLREVDRGLPVTLPNVQYRGQPLIPRLDVGCVKIVQTKRRGSDVRALAEADSQYLDVPELVLVCDDDVKRPVARLNERGGIRQGTVVLTTAQADELEVPAGSRVLVADMPLPLPQPKGSRSSAPVSWWLYTPHQGDFRSVEVDRKGLSGYGYYVRYANRNPVSSSIYQWLTAAPLSFSKACYGIPKSSTPPKGWTELTLDLVKEDFQAQVRNLGDVGRLFAIQSSPAWKSGLVEDLTGTDAYAWFEKDDPSWIMPLVHLRELRQLTSGLDLVAVSRKLVSLGLDLIAKAKLSLNDDPDHQLALLLQARPMLRAVKPTWVDRGTDLAVISDYLRV